MAGHRSGNRAAHDSGAGITLEAVRIHPAGNRARRSPAALRRPRRRIFDIGYARSRAERRQNPPRGLCRLRPRNRFGPARKRRPQELLPPSAAATHFRGRRRGGAVSTVLQIRRGLSDELFVRVRRGGERILDVGARPARAARRSTRSRKRGSGFRSRRLCPADDVRRAFSIRCRIFRFGHTAADARRATPVEDRLMQRLDASACPGSVRDVVIRA